MMPLLMVLGLLAYILWLLAAILPGWFVMTLLLFGVFFRLGLFLANPRYRYIEYMDDDGRSAFRKVRI